MAHLIEMGLDSDFASSKQSSGRKGSKKVRTGCITCKIRKVKCDEVKPFCMRCTKTGRKCDGYLDAKAIARSRRRSSGQTPHTSLYFIYEWASQDEKRSFHFFQHVTAPTLSGDFDAFFWRVLVLQICQTEPAVKHAVLAVSSLHEGMSQETFTPTPYADGSSRQSFALQQYNKAIACMLDQMRQVDSDPLGPLLTCVLFVCIEFMQRKDKESLIHLEQGRQILSQLDRKASSTSPEMDLIKQHLVPMYTRLSLTSFMFGGSPVPIPSSLKMVSGIPSAFESIDEAQYCLYDLMDECMRFTRRVRHNKHGTGGGSLETRASLEQQQDYLRRKLVNFDVAYSLYQASSPKDASANAINLLQIHLLLTRVCIATALSDKETAFDDHLSSFSAIIPLASAFLEAAERDPTGGRYSTTTDRPTHPSGRRSMFAFDIHVISPLFFVATKCRHPLIRRAALDLLQRHASRRENLWRANVMGAIAARIIKLEESSVLPGSGSPPYHPLPSPFAQGVTPEIVWATSMTEPEVPPRAPPDAMPVQQPVLDPWFDIKPRRSSEYADGTNNTMSFPVTVPPGAYSLSADSISSRVGDLDQPIDPSLLLDAAETSSPHSFSSSFDEYSADTSPHLTFSHPTTTRTPTTHPWQPLPPSISLEPPTPSTTTFVPEPAMYNTHVRRMGSASSEDDDQDRYPVRTRRSSEAAAGKYRSVLGGEPPFDLPEEVRVHDTLIGPEKEDGSWVMMFRRLGGGEGEWDVTTEFVVV